MTDINTAIEMILDAMNHDGRDERIAQDDLDVDDVTALMYECVGDDELRAACEAFINHPDARMPHLIGCEA